MADYFTNFSFILALASTDQQDCAIKLFLQLSAIQQGEENHEHVRLAADITA